MIARAELDPELHLLRTVARSLEGRARQELEAARFGVFAALEARDADTARRWARSLRVGILALEESDSRELALEAVAEIESALGAE